MTYCVAAIIVAFVMGLCCGWYMAIRLIVKGDPVILAEVAKSQDK